MQCVAVMHPHAQLRPWHAGSICSMKRNTHFMVPDRNFRQTQGQDLLTCYQFGTKTAKHLFCR